MSSVRNPHHLVAAFRNSDRYRSTWAQFFEGRRLADDVTQAEQQEVFEESDAAKMALIAFVEDDQPFSYDPTAWDPATTEIERYIEHVRMMGERARERADREEIVELDRQRAQRHVEAAQAMMGAGFVSTIKLGRVLARLILIDAGLETFADARRMR